MEEPSNDYYESDSEKSELDFLEDLGSDKFVSPPEADKEQVKNQKQQEREIKAMVLQQERQRKADEREQKKIDTQRVKDEKKNGKNSKTQGVENETDDTFSTTVVRRTFWDLDLMGKERMSEKQNVLNSLQRKL